MKNENKEREVNKVLKSRKESSVQDWLPIEKIFDNGIVKLKSGRYIKIIKIIPIPMISKICIKEATLFLSCSFVYRLVNNAL